MSRTRRNARMHGGGRLNRIPVGPGSRNATGNPAAGYSLPAGIAAQRAEALERIGRIDAMSVEEKAKLAANLPVYLRQSAIVQAQSDPANQALGRGASQSIVEASGQITVDIRDNWEFMYMCAHGSVEPPALQPIRVPANTYIRFGSQSACAADGLKIIPDYFVNDDNNDFINQMATKYLNNEEPFLSFSSPDERQTLFENPYMANYCKEKVFKPTIENPYTCSPEQLKKTIYGPGESIINIRLRFQNLHGRAHIIGVYHVPIPTAFHATIGPYDRDPSKPADNVLFGVGSPNLKPDYIDNQLTLEDALNRLPAVPDGKVRFLFINACRYVESAVYDPPIAASVSGRTIDEIRTNLQEGRGNLAGLLNEYKRRSSASSSRQHIGFGLRRGSLKPDDVNYDRVNALMHLLHRPASSLSEDENNLIREAILNHTQEYDMALAAVILYVVSDAAMINPLIARKMAGDVEAASAASARARQLALYMSLAASGGAGGGGAGAGAGAAATPLPFSRLPASGGAGGGGAVAGALNESTTQRLFNNIKSDIYRKLPDDSKLLMDLIESRLKGKTIDQMEGDFKKADIVKLTPIFKLITDADKRAFFTKIYLKIQSLTPKSGGRRRTLRRR